ncbi:MAG: CHAT domain-containing protein [Cyanobacteria bacterium J06623_7]
MFDNSLAFLRPLLIFCLSLWLAVGMHLPAHSQADGWQLSLQAQELYRAGQLVPAATAWQSAADAFEENGDRLSLTKSLINQSQVLKDLGLYPRACKTLLLAFTRQSAECHPKPIKQLIQKFSRQNRITLVEGIGLRSLGSILQQKGMLDLARETLQLSLMATEDSSESGATWLVMGNVLHSLGDRQRDRWSYDKISEIIDRQEPNLALKPYLPVFEAYQTSFASSRETLTRTQARLNYLSLLIEIESWWQQQTQRRIESWQRLEQKTQIAAANNFLTLIATSLAAREGELVREIAFSLPQLEPSLPAIYAQLNYAQSLTELQQPESVLSILQRALQQSQQLGNSRAESYALGYLGQNYASRGQLEGAIAITERALATAEMFNGVGDTREISYLWQSQLGRLFEQSGRTEEAIAAYQLAYNTLQSLRADLNTNNQVVQFDFRQQVKPVYVSLTNLLLSDSHAVAVKSIYPRRSDSEIENENLEQARRVIESLQLAELDNFFQDPCSPTADVAVTIDDLDPEAAVIYPIMLGDRLEIILAIAGQPLQHFTTKIAATEVDQVLDTLYDNLYNRSVNNSAVNIFSTIPLNPREVRDNTQTLLPNLREIYRWTIEPLESQLASNNIKTLVFVLSGKLQNMPMAALYDGQQYLLEKYALALAPSLQLLNTDPIPKHQLKVLAAGLSQQVEVRGEIFPALTNVPQELQQIENIFPQSHQLLDHEFTLKNIKQQIQKNFPIIHLATHGWFSSDPDKTFIVTGDRNIINLADFSTLLASSRSRPELIVLSACDTATGDERAVLGLAGVAVRSGSSTIASLWSVEDASTSRLMSRFYRQLENPNSQKVESLQQAQLSLIADLRANPPLPELRHLPPHPYYWAAYVLVGNWQ